VTRVLGVHGIGKYGYFRKAGSVEDAGAVLAAEWVAGLAPESVDLRVAYYAHHLHRGTAQGPADDPAILEPAAQDLLVDWVDLLAPRAVPQGPRTVRVRQAADWLTRHFGPAGRLFAMMFCREVHTYLSTPDSPRRRAARDAVVDAIEAHQPAVVVAHSLGSVVTYEALWHRPDLAVPLLVTLGSPLAMPGVVLERLCAPERGRPPKVDRWVNLADIGDLVALPRDGLGAAFTGVTQDIPVTIGTWDFHTVGAYLRAPTVREALFATPT
jgi:hypothetical protein